MASETRQPAARWVATGVAGGLLSGLTGVGGGAVMVPLLTGLLRMPQHRAHATSLAIIIFTALAALVPYLASGEISWGLVAGLGIGAIAAAPFGARAMIMLPERWLRLFFALFLFAVGVRMLFV